VAIIEDGEDGLIKNREGGILANKKCRVWQLKIQRMKRTNIRISFRTTLFKFLSTNHHL